jgi:hypothetical protein
MPALDLGSEQGQGGLPKDLGVGPAIEDLLDA